MWFLILSVLIGMITNQAVAQEKKPGDRPNAVVTREASITATVEAIDYDKANRRSEGTQGQCCHAQGRSGGEELQPGSRPR